MWHQISVARRIELAARLKGAGRRSAEWRSRRKSALTRPKTWPLGSPRYHNPPAPTALRHAGRWPSYLATWPLVVATPRRIRPTIRKTISTGYHGPDRIFAEANQGVFFLAIGRIALDTNARLLVSTIVDCGSVMTQA